MSEMRLLILLVLAELACCGGCRPGNGRVPVEGVVTLDGKPMPGVQIMFDQPELSPNENKGYIGKTDPQGRYALRQALEEGVGAMPGKYRVSLTTAVSDPAQPAAPQTKPTGPFYPEAPPPPPERIPAAYRGGKLQFTVPPEGTDKADFALKSK